MSEIARAFASGKAFIAFVTGGDPDLERSERHILDLVAGGADLIEIGVPFSDPIAEGPVIQAANLRALRAGATLEGIFQLAQRVHAQTDVPLVFLTYLNPVFHYGYEAFCQRASAVGASGLIIPDLPFEEQGELRPTAARHGLDLITLVAPTSADRIRRVAQSASGFIYVVSSLGVTGQRSQITTDLKSIVDEIRLHSSTPVAVGFGVHTPQQANQIAQFADGVIVGSKIVSLIGQDPTGAGPALQAYAQSIKRAILD
ncbi:MAG: tryptophan synthase subunit alpha [Propionibacteriaceae bacterium]|jgi:tryptophan synthase alpha chain|nr:tryptophan synthase subunit alpha [Propionibacteriaceae bacterium]